MRFDHTLVTADLTNMPAVIEIFGTTAATANIDPEIVQTTAGNQCNADGSDIRITTDEAGTTQLPVDVVTVVQSATRANCMLEVWTLLPTISSASDTVLWVWYKNPSATAPAVNDPSGRNAVWADFKCVFHLNESSGAFVDSTGSGYDGTAGGSSFPNQHTNTTLYGYSQNFVAANSNYVEIADTAGVDRFDITGNVHISALIMMSAWNNDYQNLCSRGQGWTRLRKDGVNDAIGFSRVVGANTYVGNYSAGTVANSTWHNVGYNFNRTTGVAGIKVDGSDGTTDTHAADTSSYTYKLRIGLNEEVPARKWNGYIKEFRVAAVSRAATWGETEGWLTCYPGTIGIYDAAQDSGTSTTVYQDKIFDNGFDTGFDFGTE